MSSWWDEMERRVRARGVRVEERLALLALLREPDASARLDERRRALQRAVEDAIASVRAEALKG